MFIEFCSFDSVLNRKRRIECFYNLNGTFYARLFLHFYIFYFQLIHYFLQLLFILLLWTLLHCTKNEISIKDQETADLVTFTEKILSGKLHFLRSAISSPRCPLSITYFIFYILCIMHYTVLYVFVLF